MNAGYAAFHSHSDQFHLVTTIHYIYLTTNSGTDSHLHPLLSCNRNPAPRSKPPRHPLSLLSAIISPRMLHIIRDILPLEKQIAKLLRRDLDPRLQRPADTHELDAPLLRVAQHGLEVAARLAHAEVRDRVLLHVHPPVRHHVDRGLAHEVLEENVKAVRDVHGLLGGLGGPARGVGGAVVVGEVEFLAEEVEAVDLVEDVDLGDVRVGAEVVGETKGERRC